MNLRLFALTTLGLASALIVGSWFVSAREAHAEAATMHSELEPSSLGAQLSGLWETLDDKTQEPSALVELQWNGDSLSGKVVKILKEGVSASARCVKCKGERKDLPIVGLVIVWNLREEGGAMTGGEVLDPSSGKIYRAKITLAEPNRLELRGFIGIPTFGRTQTWKRFFVKEASSREGL